MARPGRKPRTERFDNLTAAQIGSIWAKSPQTVGYWHVKQGCPRNPDGTYDLRAVVEWREGRIAQDDVEAGPGGSPALEEYRKRKAELAALDLEERRGNLLRKEVMRQQLERMAVILRGASERLQVAFGLPAKEMLDEAINDFLREIEVDS